MKRRIMSWIVTVLTSATVVLCGFGLLISNSKEEVPAWIEGTLMISSLGSEKLSDDYSGTDQYIFAYDFSNHTVDSIQIPLNSRLITYKGTPVIFYRRNEIDWPVDNIADLYAYRRYNAAEVEKSADGYEIEKFSCQDRFWLSVQPIVVYGMAGEGTRSWFDEPYRICYYLGYGVSENGELETRLMSESTDHELTVYRSFPSDQAALTYVSVSPSGRVAWRERDRDGHINVFVSDGQNVFSLPDEQMTTDSICWIDDNRLLYTADITDITDITDNDGIRWEDLILKFVPRIWHVDTGIIEDLNSTWKDTEVVFPFRLQAMAVNQSKSLVAGYLSPMTEGAADKMGRIVIFSLISGDSYTFVPGDRKMTMDDGQYFYYGKDDNGTIIYNPGDAVDINLVWGNEE